MRDLSEIKACYLAQPPEQRLGYLAMNLARLRTLAKEAAASILIDNILYESKYLIEWTACEFDVETTAELVELQVQLARWQLTLNHCLTDNSRNQEFITQIGNWLKKVLQMSQSVSENQVLSA